VASGRAASGWIKSGRVKQMTNFMTEYETRYPTQAEVDIAVARAKRMRAEAVRGALSGLWAGLRRVLSPSRKAASRAVRTA